MNEKINSDILEPKDTEIKHSKIGMISYGFGKFVSEFFNIAFGAMVFFFYEVELGLDPWLAATAFIIFAVWNAINDPIIGYLTDRPFKFTKRGGRRRPWILIGGIPWIASWLLIFLPSIMNFTNALLLFLWLVGTTCLYDTFFSLFGTNFYALFPDKFRGDSERRMASLLSTLVGVLGTAAGSIVPPLFYNFGDLNSYLVQAGIVVIICFIGFGLMIPGVKEDQVRIDSYLESHELEGEQEEFFTVLKKSLKYKSFVAYIIAFLFYQGLVQTMIGSINYTVRFTLGRPSEDITLVMAAFLIGAIISMPIWSFIANKTNNDRKTIILASLVLTLVTGVIFFITDYWLMVFTLLIWGFAEGGFWVMMAPVFANAIDESIADTGKRREGIFNGIQTFVGRFALVLQAVTFAVIHTLTGFVECETGVEFCPQLPEAIIGIRLHQSIVPMIFMAIATIILWRFYKLTPDRVKAIKDRIIELNI